jgi:hypothetical protein
LSSLQISLKLKGVTAELHKSIITILRSFKLEELDLLFLFLIFVVKIQEV